MVYEIYIAENLMSCEFLHNISQTPLFITNF